MNTTKDARKYGICQKSRSLGCPATIKVIGRVSLGTAVAIERGEHIKGCPTLSDWIENSNLLTDDMVYKRNDDGLATGYKIDIHKYFVDGVRWRCTSKNCSGSIKIKGGRYSELSDHSCDVERNRAIGAKRDDAKNNRMPYKVITFEGRGDNAKVTEHADLKNATHYLVGKAKYSKERKECTGSPCNSRITVYEEDKTASVTEHQCKLKDQ